MTPGGRGKRENARLARWLVCVMLAIALFGLETTLASAVELLEFRAEAQTNGSIIVTWQTYDETDVAGYRLYRATSSSGPWGSAIASQSPNTSVAEPTYTYTDSSVAFDVTYYYRLQWVDASNNATALGDPISAKVNSGSVVTSTPTPTPTATTTPVTPTQTPTKVPPPTPTIRPHPTATKQFTNTPVPYPTYTPRPSTATRLPTITPTLTPSPLPAAVVSMPTGYRLPTAALGASPLSTPTRPTPSPSATPKPRPSATPTITPSATPTLTPTITPSPTTTSTPQPVVFAAAATEPLRTATPTATAPAPAGGSTSRTVLLLGGISLGLATVVGGGVLLFWRLRRSVSEGA